MESIYRFWGNVANKVKEMLPIQVFPATVCEVDEKKRVCKVKADIAEYEDVRLYAVVDDAKKGFCLIPKKDSGVLVGRIGNSNELCVVMCSEVDKILGTIGDKVEMSIDEESLHYKNDKTDITAKSAELSAKIDSVEFEVKGNKIKVKADGIEFNDGNNGGLAIVDKIKSNLDAIKNYITAMNAAVIAGLNGVGVGPAAAGTAGATAYNGAMTGQSITFSGMNNDKVKH